MSCCCQVVDAKQAGAAGVLGVIANVLGKSTPILSSFSAAVGMDAPVEVLACMHVCARVCVRACVRACTCVHVCVRVCVRPQCLAPIFFF